MMITVSHKQLDQGNTVYARTITGERIPVYTEPVQHWRARWYEWEEILREAENNPALDDLLKKAEMVYALTK
jgi:hypothetical protein